MKSSRCICKYENKVQIKIILSPRDITLPKYFRKLTFYYCTLQLVAFFTLDFVQNLFHQKKLIVYKFIEAFISVANMTLQEKY